MAVPYTFGTATAAIPLSQLDSNFATAITLGNTAVYLGNTTTSIGNLTLTNVTISSGNVTLTNVSVTTANVSGTANITTLVATNDATISGLTVGRGGAGGAANTAYGASAIPIAPNSGVTAIGSNAGKLFNTASDTGQSTFVGYFAGAQVSTGTDSTFVGGSAGTNTTTGAKNTAVGSQALYSNTTASNNTAVGYQAGYTGVTAANNTFVGYQAGYYLTKNRNTTIGVGAGAATSGATAEANTIIGHSAGNGLTSGSNNTFVGGRSDSGTNEGAGFALTTGGYNNFFGGSAGAAITTGSKNTILGNYNGNQGGLDIRTSSNYIVLSDGDGNRNAYWDNTGAGIFYAWNQGVASRILTLQGNNGGVYTAVGFSTADNQGWNAANTVQVIGKNVGSDRSINAAGTINASGADYAEYMTKANDFTIAKGDVVGIDAQGKLTNVFANAVSFVVKSTNPSYVGGDTWGVGFEDDAEGLEVARQRVDRIAFAGQVPVNVTGATAGQYIIPVNDNGAIKGEAVSNPTFEQYQIAVGKVIAIESDGRAKIIVKVA